MPNKLRPDPIIPDHEVLRKIGGGAYGEVWLARGVTGALRAVKIVWREDFEDARGFEREFEGILKFEPISRDHPGLVNVLHVGRSPDGTSFYYYVMELGDDVANGQDINPVEYEPRTLRADAKISAGTRMETSLCIDVGIRLADALDHLHERGLAHRDVKPANVIFVNGKAKLADIGLVAARDQRTFVGTEGFVPPEGPGSAPADVYSLGKVLYEIATGKDRLDFPELPDELPPAEERKRWLDLNRVICDICDPYLSRRKITSAGELADALRRLQRGKRRRSTGLAAWVTSLVLGGFIVFGAWEALKDNKVVKQWIAGDEGNKVVAPPEVLKGKIRVVSYPEGAEVRRNGVWLGVTSLEQNEEPVGSEVEYTISMLGYKEMKVHGTVPKSAVTEPMIIGGQLEEFKPPEPGFKWENQGIEYAPVPPDGIEHISPGFVTDAAWSAYMQKNAKKDIVSETLKLVQGGRTDRVVLVKQEEALAYCEWLRADAFQNNRLAEDDEIIPLPDEKFTNPGLTENARTQGLKPFRVLVRPIPYGHLLVTSDPPGARVTLDDKKQMGETMEPLSIQLRPGKFKLKFTLDGYAPKDFTGELGERESQNVNVVLSENKGVRFEKPWENSLGMKMVPVGTNRDLMVCIWETRVVDFDAYINSPAFKQDQKKPGQKPLKPTAPRPPGVHPVANINRDMAERFCEWLTAKEQAEFRIATDTKYRLPTDLEWSGLVGLTGTEGEHHATPGARDGDKAKIFPWGSSLIWPPPAKWANLADIAASNAKTIAHDHAILGYDDSFPKTAPVGSFPPTMVGGYAVYDLCGNVQEWVADNYHAAAPPAGKPPIGVLRGGGWTSFKEDALYLGARNAVPANVSDECYGFRVVLAKETLKPDKAPDSPTH